jgi:putative oxidoreductase
MCLSRIDQGSRFVPSRHPAHFTEEPVMNDSHRIDLAAGLLRSGLGVMFIAHALLKVFVFTPAGTAQFFESLGLPGFLGYAIIAAELGGGVMLLLGAYTRVVAFALVPVLLGATWAHVGNGWLFTAPKGGWEYPAFLTLAAVVVGLLGGGRYSIGALFGPKAQTAGGRLQGAV